VYVCVHSFEPPCMCVFTHVSRCMFVFTVHSFEPPYVCVHQYRAAEGLCSLVYVCVHLFKATVCLCSLI